MIVFLKLRRSLIGAVLQKENSYLADHSSSPFVMGLFRPKTYCPSSLSENEAGARYAENYNGSPSSIPAREL